MSNKRPSRISAPLLPHFLKWAWIQGNPVFIATLFIKFFMKLQLQRNQYRRIVSISLSHIQLFVSPYWLYVCKQMILQFLFSRWVFSQNLGNSSLREKNLRISPLDKVSPFQWVPRRLFEKIRYRIFAGNGLWSKGWILVTIYLWYGSEMQNLVFLWTFGLIQLLKNLYSAEGSPIFLPSI